MIGFIHFCNNVSSKTRVAAGLLSLDLCGVLAPIEPLVGNTVGIEKLSYIHSFNLEWSSRVRGCWWSACCIGWYMSKIWGRSCYMMGEWNLVRSVLERNSLCEMKCVFEFRPTGWKSTFVSIVSWLFLWWKWLSQTLKCGYAFGLFCAK